VTSATSATDKGEDMLKTKQLELAVRFYDNAEYGTTYGKGLFRKAILNGSIDVKAPTVKYLIDLYEYDDWSNLARTDEQMEIIREISKEKATAYSWIQRYNKETKQKTSITGFTSFNCESKEVRIMILDPDFNIEDSWLIEAKLCQSNLHGLRSPQFLATNSDLESWRD
jgi:hypothetical protein